MVDSLELNEQASDQNDRMTLSIKSVQFLKEIAKWTRFLSILGFVIIGITLIIGIFFGSAMSTVYNSDVDMAGFSVGLIYFVIAAIYFFPIYYLYKFSSKLLLAIKQNDDLLFEIALRNLKSHYKYIGVVTVVIMVFYLIIGLIVLSSKSLI